MAAANEERIERRALADEHGTYALGGVHLMAADGEDVATDAVYIDGNFACSLHGVDVEENAGLCCNAAYLFDRLHDSGFIIGEHDADEACLRADSAQNVHRGAGRRG